MASCKTHHSSKKRGGAERYCCGTSSETTGSAVEFQGPLYFAMMTACLIIGCGDSVTGLPDATVQLVDAGTLSVRAVCEGGSSSVCARDSECFDPPFYPAPCAEHWLAGCCEGDGICDEPTDTTQADLDRCIADLNAIPCADLAMGLPPSCVMIGAPRVDAGMASHAGMGARLWQLVRKIQRRRPAITTGERAIERWQIPLLQQPGPTNR